MNNGHVREIRCFCFRDAMLTSCYGVSVALNDEHEVVKCEEAKRDSSSCELFTHNDKDSGALRLPLGHGITPLAAPVEGPSSPTLGLSKVLQLAPTTTSSSRAIREETCAKTNC
jgi:hypothetical protein